MKTSPVPYSSKARARSSHSRKKSPIAGVAIYEFLLCSVFLFVLCFGGWEMGRFFALKTRLSGAARTAAMSLLPSNIEGSIHEYPDKIFDDMIEVTRPNEFDNGRGLLTISFIQRNPEGEDDETKDYLLCTEQYTYPSGVSNPSRLGLVKNQRITLLENTYNLKKELLDFNQGNWFTVVEVSHPVDMITPLKPLMGIVLPPDIFVHAMF
jgi:hypothetical protein